ncbi:hypothetical protein [Streptomyces olivaceoviridis]|uniref:hypothetical protein n=1 Tax=Streptomyces olivaceoviridis TaxID=1921 RepID=UPI003684DB8C
MGDARWLVSGVQHDQDLRGILLHLAGDESLDDLADPDDGHCGDVGAALQADRIQHRRQNVRRQ